jgi:TolB-like protein
MKKDLLFLFLLLLSINVFAQTASNAKIDIVLKANGDEMKGKVTKVTDTDVSFIYTGESAEYVIKKSDILKISYASGRVETLGQAAIPAQERQKEAVTMSASPTDHHNKIAILPFTFLMDNQAGADAVGYKAQDDAYGFLSKHVAGYTIVDPRTTNALLAKAGVTKDKMMNFTMKEIGDILGVEYIIDGAITQNKGYETSTTSANSDTKIKKDDKDKIGKISSYGSTYSSAAQRYDVAVSLHIYMDNNASIFNQSHKAFLSSTDASYTGPLEYLLKRCPLYSK